LPRKTTRSIYSRSPTSKITRSGKSATKPGALQYDSAGDLLRGGIEQTLKGFEAILASEGVTVIEVLGKPFDPRVAEAIATSPAEGGVEDDTVTEVAQKGYGLGEYVLRPAKVIVAKHSG
jgi:molecular chaperone GrpE (heat shock protein)